MPKLTSRLARPVLVAAVSLLLVAGGAFAGNAMLGSGHRSDDGQGATSPVAAPSAEPGDDNGGLAESAEPAESADDTGGANESAEPGDDNGGTDGSDGDDGAETAEPAQTDGDHGGDSGHDGASQTDQPTDDDSGSGHG